MNRFLNIRRAYIILVLMFSSLPLLAQTEEPVESGMTQSKMALIIAELVGEYQGTENNLQFVHNDVLMALISDEKNNRMRIIAPIIEVSNLSDDHLRAAMVSNFHLALDARYAIGNGVLYATYIHPLRELTKDQLQSAVRQVSNLKTTFGSTYTSGELQYGGRNQQEQDI